MPPTAPLLTRSRRLAHLGLIAATAATAAALPASAGAVAFGPDLNAVEANSNAALSCGAKPPWAILAPNGAASCMYSALDFAGPSLRSPGTGTVTSVSVKVGNVTGPMRVNVVRNLYQNKIYVGHPQAAGPFLQLYGPTFTPAANTTTTIPVNLPMTQDPTPSQYDLETIAASDALALEVLAPDVPVPLFPASFTTVTDASYPGPTQLGLNLGDQLPNYRVSGFGVALSADITPGAAPVVVPGGGASGAGSAPPVLLGKTTVPVKSNSARIPLVCQVADCSGVLTLLRSLPEGATRSATAPASKSKKKSKKAKSPKKLGSHKFSTTVGKTTTVKVKLNKEGRKLSRAKKKFTAYARITYKGSSETTYFKVRLKR